MRITFYETAGGRRPVEEYLRSLERPERARAAEGLQNIQRFGFEAVGVQFRQIRGKLWEIRIQTGEAHRFFYVMASREEMVLLHAYRKKTQKAPSREIATAERRLKEVLHGAED
ncbi:MAG: type II toxin-antitoxin system RelE/ParE family toxin [Candidatus Rokubacteria bacterium]|nr:type II toxin-antitoxin system RelE/ParE family toxin [Candidatus Rokubacteria bacterium]